MEKGTLEVYRCIIDGKSAARVVVRGNVGKEGWAILDNLGMTPVEDISNCHEKMVYSPSEFHELSDALRQAGVV